MEATVRMQNLSPDLFLGPWDQSVVFCVRALAIVLTTYLKSVYEKIGAGEGQKERIATTF